MTRLVITSRLGTQTKDARGHLGPRASYVRNRYRLVITSRTEDLLVPVPHLEAEREARRRVDAAAVRAPRVDRVPRPAVHAEVRVLALAVDDVGLERRLPLLPEVAADLEHREGRVVPVVHVDRAVVRVPLRDELRAEGRALLDHLARLGVLAEEDAREHADRRHRLGLVGG